MHRANLACVHDYFAYVDGLARVGTDCPRIGVHT
jgi:hypothetical protein